MAIEQLAGQFHGDPVGPMRRIKVINSPGSPACGLPKRISLVPIDIDSGQVIRGVSACRIEQNGYNQLPKLIIELIDFEAEIESPIRWEKEQTKE